MQKLNIEKFIKSSRFSHTVFTLLLYYIICKEVIHLLQNVCFNTMIPHYC
nr:MAG TPA: hypothetical protein [Caudoviricetes sp.]